ncbi:MAG: S9 family peptidase, partial [Acidimicrobiales bacterium]
MAGMTPGDIGGLRQAEDPRVSPDGAWVAFSVQDVDLEANEYRARIWLAPAGGPAPALAFTGGKEDRHPRWAPDSCHLALVGHEDAGTWELSVVRAVGGGERQRVCRWPERIEELAWSPDGTTIAFVARDRDEDRYGKPGEDRREKDMPPRRVTRLFSRRNGPGWVLDRPTRVFVVPADGSARPRSLSPGDFQAEGPAWSPDGTRIAFASGRHDTWDLDRAVDLWAVAADGSGEPERLTETLAEYTAPAWSPDGRHLAYLCSPTPADEPRHTQVGVLDLASGRRVTLTEALDRTCAPFGATRPPAWMGGDVVFGVEDAGNVHVYRADAAGRARPEPILSGDRCVRGWDWAGGTLAFVATTPTTFPELVTTGVGPAPQQRGGRGQPEVPASRPISQNDGLAEGVERRLTDLTGAFAARVDLVAPERFVARSADGTEVECWAMAPAGAEAGRRHPTLLNVHGGPFTQYGNRFFDEFQLEAGAGFGVVYCNPRGSSGYSEAWGRAVRWPECGTDPGSGWGGVDYEDVMACVEEACRRFAWVDPDRLGVLGGSYGGYMTSWIIGHTDRFKAACSERAVNNLLTLETSSDIATAFRGYVGRTHLEDPGAYLDRSPIRYVDAMTTPVLLVHS